MRRPAFGILTACLLLAVSGAAHAAEPGFVDAAATRGARARFEEGLAAVKGNRFDEARVAFTQAFAVIHSLDILWNLGLAEEKGGHLVEPRVHFPQVDRQA